MRKGINVALMTAFAVALMGLQTVAFSMAPVIASVPDPVIVGDMELSTPAANYFVFEDAFDLTNIGADESILPEDLFWTFTIASGSGVYTLNGVPGLNLATEDPQSPPAAKVINDPANVSPYEWNPDGDAMTVTVRNENLSPLDDMGLVTDYPDPVPNTPGIIVAEDAIVTLFVSDGTSIVPNYGQADMTFRSDNGGNDRIGNEPRAGAMLTDLDFVANGPGVGADAWVSGDVIGSILFDTKSNGLGIEAPDLGDNVGVWTSPDQFIDLVANSVWRLRLTVTSDVTTPFAVPLWDIIVENFDQTTGGPFAYGGDSYFLDNSGGANAAGVVGRTNFEVWYTPMAIQTTQFAGALNVANDAINDMRVRFRVLDAGSAGINANFDAGTVSLQALQIHRFDLTKAVPVNVFNAATITQGAFGADEPSDFTVSFLEGASVDFANSIVTIKPNSAVTGWRNEVVLIVPGDNFFNINTGLSVADNFPIVWEANTLYRTQATIAAANATGQSNPSDVMTLNFDCPTNELMATSYVTAGTLGMGMVTTPTTAAQVYQTFAYSHSVSRSSSVGLRAFRPLIQLLNAESVVLNGIAQNTGGIKLSAVKVDKITFSD